MGRESYLLAARLGMPEWMVPLSGQLNDFFERLDLRLGELEGIEGQTPAVTNDMDLGGNRLTNLGRSQADSDAVTRGEMAAFGLYARPGTSVHETKLQIKALGGLEVPTAIELPAAVNLAQLESAIAEIVAPPGSLTAGRVVFVSATGTLTDDADFTFVTDTLTITKIAAFTLTGKLTAGAVEIEGSAFDINGGTVDGITSLTVANDVDIGNHDIQAATGTFDSSTLAKASGNGIKVDISTPTFGWRDLLGDVTVKNTGGSRPALIAYRDGLLDFEFAAGEEEYFKYHIPHDYVKGTDIFLHFHWSTNVVVTGGTLTFDYEISYAKGHAQAAFPASVSGTVISATASTTQYTHELTEVQISASSPSGSQIDTDDLEPDGIIICTAGLNANNLTVGGGGVPDPFIHYVDIHYQSTNIATKDKVPDFYA